MCDCSQSAIDRHGNQHHLVIQTCRIARLSDAGPMEEYRMRTTIALDDELVARAQAFTGLKERSALLRAALTALIERESARRLASLGGSEPMLKPAPRRRPEPT
jgi:Bacterial antitoxin of type II TA system, VapB